MESDDKMNLSIALALIGCVTLIILVLSSVSLRMNNTEAATRTICIKLGGTSVLTKDGYFQCIMPGVK